MSLRIEQKLAVDATRLPEVDRFLMAVGATQLHPDREVVSLYFDTPDLRLYRDSNEGSVPRIKVRVRCYGPCRHQSEPHWLEVKTSAVEGRYKTTSPLVDLAMLASGLDYPGHGLLRPTTVVSYVRAYYAVAGVRLTVDRDITYRGGDYQAAFPVTDPHIAVEVKAPFGHSADDLLADFPFPRVRFSKYARSVAALDLA